MARPTTKAELLEAAEAKWDKLWTTIESLGQEALNHEFDFSDEPQKKEAHWTRDKNLRDVLIHLYEWHRLLLNWVETNQKDRKANGQGTPFLPERYNWKTYGDMNVEFWKKHQSTAQDEAEGLVKESHAQVLELIGRFTNEELFAKKHFAWTGTTTLGSYCVSATASHYDWALRKLRAHGRKFS